MSEGRVVKDEALASALGVLRSARMSEHASARLRQKLDRQWRDRGTTRRRIALPWYVPSVATALLVVAIAATTLRAGADSALYGARIAIEDAFVALHTDLDDRLDYIRGLYDERTEEAAKAEAVGNALAAGRARAAQDDALRLLNSTPKQEQEPAPTPTPSPEPSSSPAAVVPSPTPSPAQTPPPAATRAPAAAPTKTDVPGSKPTPKPTPTTFVVTARGGVQNPDGSLASDVCVSTAPMTAASVLTTTPSCFAYSSGGAVTVRLSARQGQTITLYFSKADTATGKTLKGQVTFTVTGPSVTFGIVKLNPL